MNKQYVEEHPEERLDIQRGLYPLSIPSNCIVKCDLFEYAHVYKMRNKNSNANPELRNMIENLTSQLGKAMILSDDKIREFLMNIPN